MRNFYVSWFLRIKMKKIGTVQNALSASFSRFLFHGVINFQGPHADLEILQPWNFLDGLSFDEAQAS